MHKTPSAIPAACHTASRTVEVLEKIVHARRLGEDGAGEP